MILCCGEALVDMVSQTVDGGGVAYAPHAGGAVMNTAVGLGRLDVPTEFLCGLGTDVFSTVLKDHMHDSNVGTDMCPTYAAPTTLAFVTLTNGQAKYAFFDENSALRALETSDVPALPDSAKALFFGGISLTYGTCAQTYEAIMSAAAPSRLTMMDPNIRPDFVRDEAEYRARLDRMIGLSDVIKLSDEDLLWLEEGADIDAAAKAILARGAKLVLITMGSEGATAYHRDFTVTRPVVPVDLSDSDTIGAGDTFNAGFLASLHKQDVLSKGSVADMDAQTASDAVDLAIAAAAVTVSRKGANPPWSHELAGWR